MPVKPASYRLPLADLTLTIIEELLGECFVEFVDVKSIRGRVLSLPLHVISDDVTDDRSLAIQVLDDQVHHRAKHARQLLRRGRGRELKIEKNRKDG